MDHTTINIIYSLCTLIAIMFFPLWWMYRCCNVPNELRDMLEKAACISLFLGGTLSLFFCIVLPTSDAWIATFVGLDILATLYYFMPYPDED